MVSWRPTRTSRTSTIKDILFFIGDWNAKVGSQEIPGVTGEFGLGEQNEVGQRLTEFCQDNSFVIANTLFQQHKRWLYTWTSPIGQYQNQIDYILWSQRWRSCIESAKTRPGADCGKDHQLLFAKLRLKSRKQGETTRPARYDANQSPYSFLRSSDSKVSPCNAEDPGSVPGLGKSHGEKNGNPLQYSCLENPMDRGASYGRVHGVAKSWTWLSNFTFFLINIQWR